MSAGCQGGPTKFWRIAAVFAATGALVLSGCASGTDTKSNTTTASGAGSAAKVDAIANTVPEAIKSSGKLVVGVNIPYTPNEFKDPNGKIVGFDVDLMNAIAGTLGLSADFREADFAKIIPSIQGDTFNVGMSSFTDTKEREKTVDFVTYFSAGILWAQRPGDPDRPQQRLRQEGCGAGHHDRGNRRACLPRARRARTPVSRRSRSCKFDGQDAATNAVVLGQVDAMSADSPVTLYAIKQSNGKLTQAGEVMEAAPYGWPVAKGSPLAQSLKQALEHLIETGKYKEIATNWGVEKGMIDKPVINGAIS